MAAKNALVEREVELSVLSDVLAAARDGVGRMIVLEGEAGVGKTALLDHACREALSGPFNVRSARGSAVGVEAPFRVVVDLFEEDVKALIAADRMSGVAALALPLFQGGSSQPSPAPRVSLLEGLFRLVEHLSAERPLVLFLDEGNWIDEGSLAFLAHLVDRLEDLAVTVLMAARRPRASYPKALQSLVDHPAMTSMLVRPLSPEGTAELIRRVAFPAADVGFRAACYEATRGNPFFLGNLLAEIERHDLPAAATSADRVRRIGSHGVAAAIMDRLESLGPEAIRVAKAAAVLQEDAYPHLVGQLAGLPVESVSAQGSRLIASGILALGEPLLFVHPIVRSSIRHALTKEELSHLHARAALVLAAGDAPADRLAPHVLASHPGDHPSGARILSEAADIAAQLGAIGTRVTYLRRLLLEPLDAAQLVRVLTDLGEGESLIGEPEALDRFRTALDLVSTPEERAKILGRMGHALVRVDRKPEAADAFKRGLEELGSAEGELRDDLAIGFVLAGFLVPQLQAEATSIAISLLPRIPPTPTVAQRALLAATALARVVDLDAREESVALACRAVGDGELLAHETSDGPTFSLLTGVFTTADRFDETLRLASMGLEDARRRGSMMGFATASYCRCQPLLFVGRVADAIADGEHVIAAGRFGWRLYWPAAISRLAIAQMEAGDLEAAERTLHLLDEERYRDSLEYGMYLEARGYLRLLQGRLEEAAVDLLEHNRIFSTNPFVDNPGFPQGRATSVEVLAALGRVEEGLDIIEPFLDCARRWGAPRPIGTGLRARGIALSGTEGIECLEESVEILKRSSSRLERVKSEVVLGAMLATRSPADARKILASALDEAQRMQANLIADRAMKEMVRAGGRPRRLLVSGLRSLTPAEQRVARMITQGLSNPEIAERLFVTTKAVERHVGSIYSKLEVRSRPELLSRFGTELQPNDP